MAIFEAGRVCRKTAGLEAGKLCIALGKAEKGMVEVVGPNVKKSRANIHHLEPLPNTVSAGKNTTQEEAAEALKKEGLIL
jgi:ribosomal protein L14E/L6E/L27E